MNKEKVLFENSNTEGFIHNDFFIKTYVSYTEAGKGFWEKYTQLFSDNRDFFIEKLGKQHFCTSDSANRRLYCWRVELTQGTLYILTAKERGTSYERVVKGNSGLFDEEIKKYLFDLFSIPEVKTKSKNTLKKFISKYF